jgi:hypothetical protein
MPGLLPILNWDAWRSVPCSFLLKGKNRGGNASLFCCDSAANAGPRQTQTGLRDKGLGPLDAG